MSRKLDLARFEELLMRMKSEIEADHTASAESRETVELDQSRVGRLSRMDALAAQAMSSAVAERRRTALRRIEAALARIDEGEFGYCLHCGDPIDVRRLDLDPATPLCVTCSRDHDGSSR
ncbi:TraR/DksA family transcriptional regulator [Rhodothalassium salexigens DSM 2132]|uniref:TraR/DksA family transcriptional regulator n=1 Tax=Rhodothalassium salexigens DSM 2132 TaxID=1188247 RepID=A0A4R2PR68_RHOSA|nr:TraR/DksA family transcriptional regulator [Rhodothalassium salexigens]MBB4210156.1 DnaK suppressor protein [Rhodothalassium salexigens DSM 2132]MBK1639317.1 hypothetical protein [Rhodothalassium salexigens DSM 2132]TCP38320.1 TraR/DksA family transcriptional regulator [Rhodothalassium salexigens DSM 2132]